ncbi:hypothetical protein [Asanoa siamensis]|uniref:Signal peptidase II n=1 Tax=Asanoa siamensis TaxID=926357 RepID=A0ABQ4CM49_9ACTN|nr:hypothetical protein [Asanoa siamensis]GIF72357.1 hypothetical protein Asi02nite_18750 [Asanoa siamensis]
MTLVCRLGWHRWVRDAGQVRCSRCRLVALTARPVQVRILWWLLVAAVAVSLTRAVLALDVRPAVEALASGGSTNETIRDAQSMINYSLYAGLALAAALAFLLVALRGPLTWARWTTVAVLGTALVGQLVNGALDRSVRPLLQGIVPEWFPFTQDCLELALLALTAAVVFLFLRPASREYFDDGLGDLDVREEDDLDRAQRAVRRRRTSS